ncbi:hypothetical protein ATCVGM07011_655R [Acanthocystis turfacea Chlorella virus GM0701.1]|nr:hypothetical protein ATCVGM07011_655R [Acanthocystis turfacea Chlorella virus GM0701.1]
MHIHHTNHTMVHSHPHIHSTINSDITNIATINSDITNIATINSDITNIATINSDIHSHKHTLIASGEQEVAVRAFIYDTLGRKGTFALYFTDLKFSQPVRLAHGCGNFVHNGTRVHFEVCNEHITLTCADSKVLENVVLAALDKHFERER